MQVLPLDRLGARERPDAPGVVDFGLFLPGVTPADGRVVVRLLHEDDEFTRSARPLEVTLGYGPLAAGEKTYGDHWSCTVDTSHARAGGRPAKAARWGGDAQRYVYHYALVDRPGGLPPIGPIVDPFTREYGCGDLPAVTVGGRAPDEPAGPALGATAHAASLSRFRLPPLDDAVIYELNLAAFDGDVAKTLGLLDHLADLGVTVMQVTPVDEDAAHVAWGYDALGYFDLAARLGGGADLQWLVTAAHERGVAVVVDSVDGPLEAHAPYARVYEALGRRSPFARSIAGRTSGGDRRAAGAAAARGATGARGTTDATGARDFRLTCDVFQIEVRGVDGFRYGPRATAEAITRSAPMYAELALATHAHVDARVRALDPLYRRFAADHPGESIKLIQIAECAPDPPSARALKAAEAAARKSAFEHAAASVRGSVTGSRAPVSN